MHKHTHAHTHTQRKSDSIQTWDAFWRYACVLAWSLLLQCRIPYAILFKFSPKISQKFNLYVMDRLTDGQTDTGSYRDARTHLKTNKQTNTRKLVLTMEVAIGVEIVMERFSWNARREMNSGRLCPVAYCRCRRKTANRYGTLLLWRMEKPYLWMARGKTKMRIVAANE